MDNIRLAENTVISPPPFLSTQQPCQFCFFHELNAYHVPTSAGVCKAPESVQLQQNLHIYLADTDALCHSNRQASICLR